MSHNIDDLSKLKPSIGLETQLIIYISDTSEALDKEIYNILYTKDK